MKMLHILTKSLQGSLANNKTFNTARSNASLPVLISF